MQVLQTHSQFVHTRVSKHEATTSRFFTVVYSSPQLSSRNKLWDGLHSLVPSCKSPWLVIVDFNAYSLDSEKCRGASPNMCSMRRFSDCLFDCGLSDVMFKGPPYTWEWRGVKERLNRGVCNTSWSMCFPEASIIHLPSFNSDHKPLLLKMKGDADRGGNNRPFRFMASWIKDNSFKHVVRKGEKQRVGPRPFQSFRLKQRNGIIFVLVIFSIVREDCWLEWRA